MEVPQRKVERFFSGCGHAEYITLVRVKDLIVEENNKLESNNIPETNVQDNPNGHGKEWGCLGYCNRK